MYYVADIFANIWHVGEEIRKEAQISWKNRERILHIYTLEDQGQQLSSKLESIIAISLYAGEYRIMGKTSLIITARLAFLQSYILVQHKEMNADMVENIQIQQLKKIGQ